MKKQTFKTISWVYFDNQVQTNKQPVYFARRDNNGLALFFQKHSLNHKTNTTIATITMQQITKIRNVYKLQLNLRPMTFDRIDNILLNPNPTVFRIRLINPVPSAGIWNQF